MNESAFLSDILDHPDDDTPRLVLADWLDDHGHADRADLIRTQIELAALPARLDCAERRADLQGKEFRLRGRVGRAAAGRWLRRALHEYAGGFPAYELRRGLVEVVSLPAWQYAKIASELFARHPIRHVRWSTLDGLTSLSECAHIERLSGLEITGDLGGRESGLRKLLQVSRLPHLRGLALRGYSLTNLLGTLTGCSALEQLSSLRLGLNYTTGADRALRAVLTSIPCAGLTELSLDGAPYNSSPLSVVADSLVAGQLSSLTLDRGHFVTLPDRPGRLLSSLRALRLRGCTFAQQANPHDLLASPELSQLMVLDLREAQFPRPARSAPRPALRVEMLAHLSNLTTLLLADQRLGDANVAKLAATPGLAHLTELSLAYNDLTDKSARTIAASPSLRRLRKLNLRGNALGPAGARALLDAPFMPQLWWLDVVKTGLNDAVAQELVVRAPSLPNLAWLDLRGNALSAPVRERLRAAFGPAVRYDAR